MMNKKIKAVALVLFSVTLFDSNAMECSEQCKNAQDYKTCLATCLQIRKPLTEEKARTEWFKRYPCTSYEESDCYYPYRGNYKKGIKRDNKRKASYHDDDY